MLNSLALHAAQHIFLDRTGRPAESQRDFFRARAGAGAACALRRAAAAAMAAAMAAAVTTMTLMIRSLPDPKSYFGGETLTCKASAANWRAQFDFRVSKGG